MVVHSLYAHSIPVEGALGAQGADFTQGAREGVCFLLGEEQLCVLQPRALWVQAYAGIVKHQLLRARAQVRIRALVYEVINTAQEVSHHG